MKEKIIDWISKTIFEFGLTGTDFVVENPADLKNGDYSSNIALVAHKKIMANKDSNILSGLQFSSPQKLAEEIKNRLEKEKIKYVSKIEVAGPGFINFFLSEDFFQDEIKNIIQTQENYGKNKKLSDKIILIDHTDPNPFKQFHIGHLMSNTIGEFISRIYEWGGAEVNRLTFQGDVGMHVAKCIWGMLKMKEAFPQDTDSQEDKLKFLGEAYTFGANQFEDDPVATSEIKEINGQVYTLFSDEQKISNLDIKVCYEKGRAWSLKHFAEIYQKLNTKFVREIYESEVFKLGAEIVRQNTPQVFELSDGAIIYKGEKEGLHTRVFINSQGITTYEAKDMGLAFFKDKLFENYHASIVITANEQNDYFKVIRSALDKIDSEIGKKTIHIGHGMMRFASGKMSSRRGNIITGESLIQDLESDVAKKLVDRDFENELKEKIKTIISIGAIKFSILKQAINKDIIFDFEKSISFEGDSGPYLQYTYTRAKSVIEKSDFKSVDLDNIKSGQDWTITNLEKHLFRFPEIIERSMNELAPQHLSNYLLNVAGEFNTFYAETKILDESENQNYKLALTSAVMIVIKNGLNVLGISVPNKM